MNKFVLVSNNELASQSGRVSQANSVSAIDHNWITVINPTNHRLLLQACDHCGVVKSENSILKACRAPKHQQLVSNLMSLDAKMVS